MCPWLLAVDPIAKPAAPAASVSRNSRRVTIFASPSKQQPCRTVDQQRRPQESCLPLQGKLRLKKPSGLLLWLAGRTKTDGADVIMSNGRSPGQAVAGRQSQSSRGWPWNVILADPSGVRPPPAPFAPGGQNGPNLAG